MPCTLFEDPELIDEISENIIADAKELDKEITK